MNKKKNILVVSYFAGMKGNVMAEWLDDKVDSFLKLGHEIFLISSISSNLNPNTQVKHYRIPSLSPTDLKHEKSELRSLNRKIPIYVWFWIPLIYTIGLAIDLILIAFTSGLGGGKISWGISGTLIAFYLNLTQKVDIIFSTGGAASSHIPSIICGIIFRKPVIVELQDPLRGEGIGRNSRSAILLGALEKWIVKHAKKVVYVTEQAAREARENYHSNNVVCIYPGSRKFDPSLKNQVEEKTKFRFVHLGTLYSTRNFNTLITALDRLIENGQISIEEFEVINLGEIYGDYKATYLAKPYIKQYPIRPRIEAVEFARQSDVNLLIQHSDARSSTTIPYKLYDYLNVKRPILGLINNDELQRLLTDTGHFTADINNVDEIAERILYLIKKKKIDNVATREIDAVEQAEQLLFL